jgi:hypothetical protein
MTRTSCAGRRHRDPQIRKHRADGKAGPIPESGSGPHPRHQRGPAASPAPRAAVGESSRPAFARRRVRSDRRLGTDHQTRSDAPRSVAAQIGPSPQLATRGEAGVRSRGPGRTRTQGCRRRTLSLGCQKMTSAASARGVRACGSAMANDSRRVLAGGSIRVGRQAQRALALPTEQPPASIPSWLLEWTSNDSSPPACADCSIDRRAAISPVAATLLPQASSGSGPHLTPPLDAGLLLA